MIICHCTGTSDRKLRREVETGARTCGEIGQRCAAGTVCGGCLPAIESMVKGSNPANPMRASANRD